jgi:hypothetical protein
VEEAVEQLPLQPGSEKRGDDYADHCGVEAAVYSGAISRGLVTCQGRQGAAARGVEAVRGEAQTA